MLNYQLLDVIHSARDRVLENKGFIERIKAFFYPETIGAEVAQELKNMGLEDYIKQQFRAVENAEWERVKAKAEYQFWKEYRREELKNKIAQLLTSSDLVKYRILQFFSVYDLLPSIDDILSILLYEYDEEDLEKVLNDMEKKVSRENKKKVKVAKKKVYKKSRKKRRRRAIFAIVAGGLMIGAAAGMYYNKYVRDSDHDGITNYLETHKYHTNPYKADTDGDGLTDYQEIFNYHTNPLLKDTDHDGINDMFEIKMHLDPLKPSLMNDTGIEEKFYEDMRNAIKLIGTLRSPSLGYDKPWYFAGDNLTVTYKDGYQYVLPMKDTLTGARLIPTFLWAAGSYKHTYKDPRFSEFTTLLYLNDATKNLKNNITNLEEISSTYLHDFMTLENAIKNIIKNPSDLQSFRDANAILTKYYNGTHWYYAPIHSKLAGVYLKDYLTDFDSYTSPTRLKSLEKTLFIFDTDKEITNATSNTTPYVSMMLDFLNEYKKIVDGMPYSKENVKVKLFTTEGMHLWSVESAMGFVMMNLGDYPHIMLKVLGLIDTPYILNGTKQSAKISSDLTLPNLPTPVKNYWINFYNSQLSSNEKINFQNWIKEYSRDNNSVGILDYLLIRNWANNLLPTKKVFDTSDLKKVDYGVRLTTTDIFDIDDKESMNFIKSLWSKLPNEAPSVDKVWDYVNKVGLALPRTGNIIYGPYTAEHAKELGKNDCATATASVIEVLEKYYPKYLPVALIKTFPIIGNNYSAVGIHNIPFFYTDGSWYGMELWDAHSKPYSNIENHLAYYIDGWVGVPIVFGNSPLEIPLRDDYLLNIMKKYTPNEIIDMMYYLRGENMHDL